MFPTLFSEPFYGTLMNNTTLTMTWQLFDCTKFYPCNQKISVFTYDKYLQVSKYPTKINCNYPKQVESKPSSPTYGFLLKTD